MEYVVSKSYRDWERIGEPYDKGGKPYTKIKSKCDRCSGLGIIASRVENGEIIPIPVDGGICYKCGGSKYITKEVRLYTPHEMEVIERNYEAAKARKETARREQMEKEYAHKKEVWLETHGFAEDGSSYIVTGETYSIKDELKDAGFKYDPVLKWHRASADGYEDRVIKIKVDDFFEFSAWGDGHYITGAADKIEALLNQNTQPSTSEWQGEVGDHIKGLSVTLVRKTFFEGRYGITNVLTFEDENKNVYTWFTSTVMQREVGEQFKIKGTIKEHNEYKGVKSTILTRVKVVE